VRGDLWGGQRESIREFKGLVKGEEEKNMGKKGETKKGGMDNDPTGGQKKK